MTEFHETGPASDGVVVGTTHQVEMCTIRVLKATISLHERSGPNSVVH